MPNPECKAESVRQPALIISLDFELHWGVRDLRRLDARERARLIEARRVIPALLQMFDEFRIHATWATVGFLFGQSKNELEKFFPAEQPSYRRAELDPYRESLGESESEDPFHYAGSLVQEVARHKGQEIATHSFSHYYCLEAGQTPTQFEADLDSALAIAAASGYAIQSYVFPRNQPQASCLQALQRAGISSYRACEPGWLNAPRDAQAQRRWYYRLGRLADAYVNLSGAKTQPWPRPARSPQTSSSHGKLREAGLQALRASRYLSPYRPLLQPFEALRLRRIVKAMEYAARRQEIFHLWWHPEDFALHSDRNLKFLRSILVAFDGLRSRFDMQSYSMAEAAAALGAWSDPIVIQPALFRQSTVQQPVIEPSVIEQSTI